MLRQVLEPAGIEMELVTDVESPLKLVGSGSDNPGGTTTCEITRGQLSVYSKPALSRSPRPRHLRGRVATTIASTPVKKLPA